ncbi:MAG: helix-turn-helix transcriptional regulator [Armatimonadetes bacterium]|jgi:transcriptional regulator with XRE-family HTH domain|nr:helix-turn-helix transcriptional regulator [Armatimonadota bacterium]
MRKQPQLKEMLDTLAGHIRVRRKAIGITQEQLAEQAGLSPNYIARLEIGSNTPSLPALISISKALGMQTFELLTVETGYTWMNKAQEIAWLLESLKKDDLEYVLDQLQATVRYIKSKHES